MTGHEQNRLIRKRPENLSAWEEFLQGLNCFYSQRKRTDHEDPAIFKAKKHFSNAIELDPAFSDAYAYLAILGTAELVQFITKDPQKTLDEMLSYGRKAEDLNPENPLALWGISATCFFRGDHTNACVHAERAIQFNPSFASSYLALGLAQVHLGDFQEAEDSILKALELSPADPDLIHMYTTLYFACYGLKRYEEALDALDKALHRHPDAGHILGFRAAVLGHLQPGPEAKSALERYLDLRPNLKTREDYKKIFIPNSVLAEPIIEGLCLAGWEPED